MAMLHIGYVIGINSLLDITVKIEETNFVYAIICVHDGDVTGKFNSSD